jgi:hypothetical protein
MAGRNERDKRMPLQYAKKINAGRSGMARTAAYGRDERLPEVTAIKIHPRARRRNRFRGFLSGNKSRDSPFAHGIGG